MGTVYTDADKITFTCCFILAVLSAAAYGRWHFWWRTGPGRGRMAVIIAFAGITAERMLSRWAAIRPGTSPDHVLSWVRTGSAALAALSLAYLLYGIFKINFRIARDPRFAAAESRRYLERTPGATEQEVKDLLARWDEMHACQRWLTR